MIFVTIPSLYVALLPPGVKDEGDEGVRGEGVRVHYLMHPSPINPAANKNWTALAVGTLRESGVLELVRGGRGE